MFEGKHDYLSPPGNAQPVVRHVLIISSRMMIRWISTVKGKYILFIILFPILFWIWSRHVIHICIFGYLSASCIQSVLIEKSFIMIILKYLLRYASFILFINLGQSYTKYYLNVFLNFIVCYDHWRNLQFFFLPNIDQMWLKFGN